MSSGIDKILDVLDVGLQRSTEPLMAIPDRTEKCARCDRRPHLEDSDFCADCRAWLLGDGVHDPIDLDRADDIIRLDRHAVVQRGPLVPLSAITVLDDQGPGTLLWDPWSDVDDE